MTKWNTFYRNFVKTQAQKNFLNHSSLNIIRNILSSLSELMVFQQSMGFFRSSTDWCCWRRKLLVLLFVEQNGVFWWTSHLQVVKRCGRKMISVHGLQTASTSNWSSSQKNSKPARLDTWYPLVSIPCRPTLESIWSFISRIFSWLGAIGTCARWLFKNSCLWDSNKLQAARGKYWELYFISRRRSRLVTVTKSGQKSRDHSELSLETEKIMLLYCRQKVY